MANSTEEGNEIAEIEEDILCSMDSEDVLPPTEVDGIQDPADELKLLMTPPNAKLHPSPHSRSCSPQVSPTLSPTLELSEVFRENIDEPEQSNDSSRSEAIIQFIIPNFVEMQSTLLSDPVYIRDLPWRLMVMPRMSKTSEGEVKTVGIFVQCSPETPDMPGWSVSARARITLLDQFNADNSHSKEIYHWFTAKENDWGYVNFLTWKEVFSDENGYIKDGTAIVEARVSADAPHGINWDSKKHTGFVGLKNQGATCYMNSLLQTLYCTNKLRKAVYQMPTENDDKSKSVAFALQRLFYDLQHSDKVVGTKKLTKSFGWDSMDTFMQHDIQELSRVLLDNMQSKMKGTTVEDCIPKLLEGKMETVISCTDIEYESRREESFFDLQLNVKGKRSLYESIKDYTAPEVLDGDNKYQAGTHGMQKAVRKVSFTKFPPILHLQLMRFQYDMYSEGHTKLNDKYEFPEHLDLDEYLRSHESTPAHYTLHAVLVHSGDNYGGHYVAYINPAGDGKWLKFDDEVVSKCSRKEAIDNNFGGSDDNVAIRNCTSAYMLCYIRDTAIADVLEAVTDVDIPSGLVSMIEREKSLEALRRKERSEAHLFMTVEVFSDDDLQLHRGPDLIDLDEMKGRQFRMLKATTFEQLHIYLADAMGYSKNQIRLWPFEARSNHTYRPGVCENYTSTIIEVADSKSCLRVYAELLMADCGLIELPVFDYQTQVLFFIKYYDPFTKSLSYMGHLTETINQKFASLLDNFHSMACLPDSVPLLIYEEVTPNRIEVIDTNTEISQEEEVRDGDIICFQRADISMDVLEMPIAPMYYKELYNRLDVIFYDKSLPGDPGFTLTLNQKMAYMQVANAVAAHIQTSPLLLQFFRPQVHRQLSDQAIRCTNEGTLRDFVLSSRSRVDTAPYLFYQKLNIPINEFETKRWFKCVFVNSKLKEEKEFTVYVDKNGTIEDLLNEARKEITFHDNSTQKLRLLEVMGSRIIDVHPIDRPVSDLMSQKMYRIEEVRSDETILTENEALIPVAHFQKVTHNTFGVPFLFKLCDGSTLSLVRENIQALLDVNDKEFDKWKFYIISGLTTPIHLSEENDPPLWLNQFQIYPSKGIMFPKMGSPWLGIDHINKNPKRTRYNVERAIKIHN